MPSQVFTSCYTINGDSGVSIGPYLFNWLDAASSVNDDYCVWEAARATSAAPTYFPLAQVGMGTSNGSNATTRWAVDGGVVANNPALYGLAQAKRVGLFNNFNDVLIVSLGTGLYNAGIRVTNDGNWGMVPWVSGSDSNNHSTHPLFNVLAMSNVLAPDQQLSTLMPAGSYYRLEPQIPYSESTMDGTDTEALLKTAISYISPGGNGYSDFQAVIKALTN